jgi:hypothetical protein
MLGELEILLRNYSFNAWVGRLISNAWLGVSLDVMLLNGLLTTKYKVILKKVALGLLRF